MAMTRKHYEKMAEILFWYQDGMHESTHHSLVDEVADFFKEDNSRFDADRFRKACGYASE